MSLFSSNIFKYHNILRQNCVKYRFRNYCSTVTKNGPDKSNKYTNFENMILSRKDQANRSVLVQVNSAKSYSELYNHCSKYGNIIGSHHYCIPEDDLHYILIEYTNLAECEAVLNASSYADDFSGIPVRSPFLWFRAGAKQQKLKSPQKTNHLLKTQDGIRMPSNNEINELLQSAESLEDQILILYRATCLNDLETRLRFLAAKQVESSIKGMFPEAHAWPFGSSVNGFGRLGCDLDLILRLESDKEKANDNSSRLVFHTKANLTNGRSQTQRQMESVGDMLQLFLPGVNHVRRILQARVPIIKYNQEHLNLEVDLSMSNLTGLYMSELLYMFGQLDDRVQPLTFCIRKWAQAAGLTNHSPGRWISNFSLTMLVMFFLQQLKNPILPPIKTFADNASKEDIRITEDQINCTFLRDLNRLQFKKVNNDPLGLLLLQFFEFYSQFDFHHRSINLNLGKTATKSDHSAMYIVNPLEQMLNISKNVSLEETERFRIEIRNAAWLLESNVQRMNENSSQPWGLLNLFRINQQSVIKPNMFFKPRMMDVSDLFENERTSTQSIDGKTNSAIEYKNNSIKSEIEAINNQAKNDINKMSMKLRTNFRRR